MQRFFSIAKALGKSGMPLPVVILLFVTSYQAQTTLGQIPPVGGTASEWILGGGIAAVLLYYLIQLVKAIRPQTEKEKQDAGNAPAEFAQMLGRFDETMERFSAALAVISKDHADMLRHDGMILNDTSSLKNGQSTILSNQDKIQKTLDGPTGIVSLIKEIPK